MQGFAGGSHYQKVSTGNGRPVERDSRSRAGLTRVRIPHYISPEAANAEPLDRRSDFPEARARGWICALEKSPAGWQQTAGGPAGEFSSAIAN